jgi:zinc transport system permease protein
MTFLGALVEHEFLRVVALAAVVAAVAGGVVGTVVVTRRLTFLAGGIAHATLGGMGIAQWAGWSLIGGAAVAAIASALLIGAIARAGRQHEDMLIGAIWAVGMAVGLIAVAHTPGYQVNLLSFLLGNLLMVTWPELWTMATITVLVLLMLRLLWRPVVATLFDEEFATTRGLPTLAITLGVLVAVALVVVVLLRAVGLVLVMALLTLPTATAVLFVRSIGWLMVASVLLALAAMWVGLEMAMLTDSPAGASIVLTAAVGYLIALSLQRHHRRSGPHPVDKRRTDKEAVP